MCSIPLTKQCTKCSKTLPLSEFHRNTKRADGYASWCKHCKKSWTDVRKQKPKITIEEKTCTKCGQLLLPGDFHKDSNRVDGLSLWCKKCAIENTKAHYYATHECQLEYRRQYAAKNRDVARLNARRNYRKNKQRHNAQSSAWQRNNPDKVNERNRRWRQANPGKSLVHRHNYLARKANAAGTHTLEQFRALVEYYGGKCLCCGEVRPFTVDHVVALSNGGTNDISNIQPLCGPCNYSKAAWHNTDYRPDGGEYAKKLAERK